ncbi:MAG: winged helix DNA-binding protein [Clostridium perfringens]|nr:winged helix DNA-binding protein [Clostridium perfringens]
MGNRCIIGKINEISLISSRYVEKRIKEENLPILRNHISLFYILPENGEKMLFNDLAKAWGISKSSLSEMIVKYENIGLIQKCVCEADRRSVYISLLPEAIKIKRALKDIEKEFLNKIMVDFNECERLNFEGALEKALKSGERI